MSLSLWKYSAAVAGLLVAMSVTAEALVCGDADDSGTVTVTDGVQTLRKAAGLSSSCGSLCDVDGSGTVTVTDGVNVLRKAANLPITENCGGVDAQIEALLGPTLPTLSIFGPLTKLGSSAQAKMGASAQAAELSLCQNDGTASFNEATGEVTFENCDLGGIVIRGFLAPSENGIEFDIEFTDVATDESVTLGGDLTTTPSGENSELNGNLTIDFSDLDLTSVDVTFEKVVTDPAGNSIGGSVLFDASGSGIEGVAKIRVGVAPATVTDVPVEVIFDDQSTRNFTFDTGSGKLTPVSS